MDDKVYEADPWKRRMEKRLTQLGKQLETANIAEYVRLLNSPRRLILINMLSGIARGVGIAIGVTIFSATIVYFLQQLGALNLPIIGNFIAELVKIVQIQLDGMQY